MRYAPFAIVVDDFDAEAAALCLKGGLVFTALPRAPPMARRLALVEPRLAVKTPKLREGWRQASQYYGLTRLRAH